MVENSRKTLNKQDEENSRRLNDCGRISSFVIMPRTRQHSNNLWYIQDFGYVQTHVPCDFCMVQVTGSITRPADWKFLCPECKNYIIYDYVGGYSNCVGKFGKDIHNISKFAQLHFFPPGKQGTIPKEEDDEEKRVRIF